MALKQGRFFYQRQVFEFEFRLTYDMADHIWCEYFNRRTLHWSHCDPCEASMDRPLLYEKGWGKSPLWVYSVGTHNDFNEVC